MHSDYDDLDKLAILYPQMAAERRANRAALADLVAAAAAFTAMPADGGDLLVDTCLARGCGDGPREMLTVSADRIPALNIDGVLLHAGVSYPYQDITSHNPGCWHYTREYGAEPNASPSAEVAPVSAYWCACDACSAIFESSEAEALRLREPGAVAHCEGCTDAALRDDGADFYGYRYDPTLPEHDDD